MEKKEIKKIAFSGMFIALAVAGSLISFPVAGSKCAPIQHLVNILSAVILGPWYALIIAFLASLIRNLLGIGSLLAFPGSMFGAFICGYVYKLSKKIGFTCLAETLATSILGGIVGYFVAKAFMGKAAIGMFVYVIPFFISTAAGSLIAYAIFKILSKYIEKIKE